MGLHKAAHFETRAYLRIRSTQIYLLQSIISLSFIPVHILNCTCEISSTYSQQVTSQGSEGGEKNKIWRLETRSFLLYYPLQCTRLGDRSGSLFVCN